MPVLNKNPYWLNKEKTVKKDLFPAALCVDSPLGWLSCCYHFDKTRCCNNLLTHNPGCRNALAFQPVIKKKGFEKMLSVVELVKHHVRSHGFHVID